MKPEKILYALNDIDGQFLREARAEAAPSRRHSRRFTVLIAAVIALMALTITAFASEEIAGWFRQYFSNQTDLSPKQIEFIEENEQIIAESQEQEGWTIELRSAINDGTTAYIIIGITAPEDVSLEQTLVDGCYEDWYGPGNGSMKGADKPDLVTCSVSGLVLQSYGFGLEEDGDGLANTKNLVIHLNPNFSWYEDPFGSDVDWYIHIENIVYQYEDEAYRQELLSGKYAGQTDIMFTSEETKNLYAEEILAEGVWDFTVNFAQNAQGTQLLTAPVETMAWVHRRTGTGIEDMSITYEKVTITSFVLNPLSAVIECSEENVNFEDMYVVMDDGSRILLNDTGSGIDAESPIVLDEVDYILLADGTKLMVP